MTVEQMRAALKKSYPAPTWAKKVDSYSDKQVIAIYTRMLCDGKLRG